MESIDGGSRPLVVGTVVYLNSRPLTYRVSEEADDVRVVADLPSRLADRLASGELSAALLPSIISFSRADQVVISDACVACEGPVRSVKLFCRVPPAKIRTLALDEGSRTSVALARILLRERFEIQPRLECLPIGASWEENPADAILLIGDRCMQAPPGRFEAVWDLGGEWTRWTGLPFVFAVWMAHPGPDALRLGRLLTAARDRGKARLAEIARSEAPALGLREADCLSYLRDHLRFDLGARERQGLELFHKLAQRHGLAPAGGNLVFIDQRAAG